jgi:hypothetical protein
LRRQEKGGHPASCRSWWHRRCRCERHQPASRHRPAAAMPPAADAASSCAAVRTERPRSFARLRPSPVRARINSRSNSAKPPSTVSISRPWALVVSAHASWRLLKPAPRAVIAAITLSRSRVDLASRSSRVTTSTSPGSSRPIAFTSSGRSVFAPDIFSLNTLGLYRASDRLVGPADRCEEE